MGSGRSERERGSEGEGGREGGRERKGESGRGREKEGEGGRGRERRGSTPADWIPYPSCLRLGVSSQSGRATDRMGHTGDIATLDPRDRGVTTLLHIARVRHQLEPYISELPGLSPRARIVVVWFVCMDDKWGRRRKCRYAQALQFGCQTLAALGAQYLSGAVSE